MPAIRRTALISVAIATLTAGFIAGTISNSAASTSPGAGVPGVTGVTVTEPPDGRGLVIDVPRDAPVTVDLVRAFRSGTVFSIALYENGSTGYLWSSSLSTGSEQVVTFLDTDLVRDPAPPNMTGVGGTRYFRFQAQHSGRAVITLLYQRSWEPEPIRRVTLTVDVC